MNHDHTIVLFKEKSIRRTLHKKEWWFSIIDIIAALTDSVNPRDYWFKMKLRIKNEDGTELSTICRQLKLPAPIRSKANLRDNMTDLELIFSMLGEKVTTEISSQEKPSSFEDNKKVAQRGGKVAGNARKDTEKELGRSIISKTNHLHLSSIKKLNENKNL